MLSQDIVIISDLHLCDGSTRNDFLPTDEVAFAAFLNSFAGSAAPELVFNGDFIDFIRIQPRETWAGADLDASEPESADKLRAIMQAHPLVFDALASYIVRGGRVRFLVGNHDLDLLWPQVQRDMRVRLGRDPLDDDSIQFGWHYLNQDVFIEHGHQADPLNRIVNPAAIIRPDAYGMPRLTRCWGTRLIEEFFNRIAELPTLDMVNNVRPPLEAAALIIKHGLWHPTLYPVLRSGATIIYQALAGLKRDEDVNFAAAQLDVSVRLLYFFVAVSGFLDLQPARQPELIQRPNSAPGRSTGDPILPSLHAPSLQQAYRRGRVCRGDPDRFEQDLTKHGLDPVSLGRNGEERQPAGGDAMVAHHRRYIEHARTIALNHAQVATVCFGHTHMPTNDHEGWPLAGTGARYFNSGSWTRTFNLVAPRWRGATFIDLTDPANYEVRRDAIHIVRPMAGQHSKIVVLRWNS